MGGKLVLLLLLMTSGVVGRNPRGPLARHRDVATTQGKVRGYFAPHPPHYAYLGLPYARPPTRARFKAPAPLPHWDGTFEAIHRIKCVQPDGSGAGNCLAVNVFAPEHADSLPVLVHIHDGGFQRGWGSHKAPERLLRLGFVIVTFNYRLGALGFLCLQTLNIPGNAGLKDQVAALYWVHRNIAKFGGNPHDVTLYGTGSGGVSVEILLISGHLTNLVHKAIIESGAVLSPSSISYDPFALAMAEAIKLGFKGGGSRELETFYNKISIQNLLSTSGMFYPCIENKLFASSLLDIDPKEKLIHGTYQHVPLLVSYTNAEELSIISGNPHLFNKTPQSFIHLLPSNLDFETDNVRDKIATLIKDFYFEEPDQLESVSQNYINYINDILVEYPITKSSVLHAAKSSHPVYLMKYTYKSGFSNVVPSATDVRHGDICNYIFSSENFVGFDEIVAERLLTLWNNFIKIGDPTPLTTTFIPVIWQPVITQDIDGRVDIRKVSYLQFDRAMSNVQPEGQQLIFWDYIYDKFYKQHV